MSVLIQISDPHFGTEQPAVVAALRALVAQLQPDLAIVSGDITQRARPEQFAAARAFLDGLQVPSIAIPGNHDIPLYDLAARALHPYARYTPCFGDDLEPEFECADVLVVTVNTTRWYRHTDGEVSREQAERVARRLRAARPGQLRIVVTHQPVSVLHKEDEKDLLNGREYAVPAWAEAGADLILGGHIHLPYVCPLHEEQTRFGALPRHVWAVQAGTAVSHRVRYQVFNSVNVVRTCEGTPRSCRIERWDFSPSAGTFGLFDTHDLALSDD
jgi:3',5'-cyclic AMP phosphodiesterase CpdA